MDRDFSDDEWDISDDQLQQLEDEAIRSTQSQLQSQPGARESENGWMNISAVNRQSGPVSLRKVAAGNLQNGTGRQERRIIQTESFDNPSLDEDGVPYIVEAHTRDSLQSARPVDEVTAREQWRQGRYAQKHGPGPQMPPRPNPQPVPRRAAEAHKDRYLELAAKYGTNSASRRVQAQHPQQLPDQTAVGPASAQHAEPQSVASNGSPIAPPEDKSALSELDTLRAERNRWEAEKQAMVKQLYTARGEINIVRKRTESELKVAARQTELLKKQMQEATQKHQASLLSKDSTLKELVTKNKFLQHEVDEQSHKIRSLQHARDRPLQERPNSINLSPRKSTTSNLRDGFDDDDIVQMSPSRAPNRRRTSKPSTPTKKRRHPGSDEMHGRELPLRLTNEEGIQLEEEATTTPAISASFVTKDYKSQRHLQVMQTVMAHRPGNDHAMVVECLAQAAYPSSPRHNLSMLLLEEIATLRSGTLPRDLLLTFIRLLARCLAENYHKPTNWLMSCALSVLDADPTLVDQEAIEGCMPTLQGLVRVNASRRFLLADRTRVWDEDNPKPAEDKDVSTYAALEIMFTMASLVVDDPILIHSFWRWADTPTILVMLHSSQRLEDIKITLDLLATSVFPTTFGIVTTPVENTALQSRTIDYVIDKIVFLLWDPPKRHIRTRLDKVVSDTPVRDRIEDRMATVRPPVPEPDLTRQEICCLRLKALETLTKFALASVPHPHSSNIRSHHGTTALLNHVNAMARLVRFLHDEVYEVCQNHPSTHHQHVELVNRAIVLIHHVLLCPQATEAESDFDLTKCLSGTLMGASKFRAVMTKLALARDASIDISPDLGLDAGITDHTRDLARDILGQYITPDEATQLTDAFGVMDVDDDLMDTELDAAEAVLMAEE